ncbi:methylated-DNA--[protein]-cysteine S-methyltransferase [Arsenicicoccus sp. oral taxon 190]|uniref:methylated-DNA--[protein]-cysteine S-methyltransferase n=1 Tax=Arsenicicoccus sp. oral taxon 190 TaxID=1658671 RepID=UPI00067A38A3|nr:methylated-DNA--[protein]-cysteine S-methyltransferase [Arsenicicoccus sp. oral taxon 190]AKT50425.1 cysteine methyltransferase [Arsenicicoccus sp. oral taxon 190]
MRRHTIIDSPVGPLTAVADDEALIAIYFERHGRAPAVTEHGERTDDHPVLAAARDQLADYFAGRRTGFDLPLAPRGDAFQQRVWAQLREIPYGQTRSYGQLARALGQPGAAQAVGNANGANPLSIVVPCHRVIGSDGSLTGYAGGLERKRWLLAHEEPAAASSGRLF